MDGILLVSLPVLHSVVSTSTDSPIWYLALPGQGYGEYTDNCSMVNSSTGMDTWLYDEYTQLDSVVMVL